MVAQIDYLRLLLILYDFLKVVISDYGIVYACILPHAKISKACIRSTKLYGATLSQQNSQTCARTFTLSI